MAGRDGQTFLPEIISNEFRTSDETYKISSFIDHRAKSAQSTCFNEPVKISSIKRLQRRPIHDDVNDQSHRTEFLMFNLSRELILYEFSSITQAHFADPVDYRVYRPTHPVTCHDIFQDVETNNLKILTGFSNGQIQMIDIESKEQKIFNENSFLDKTKVTCIKWLKSSQNQFAASFVSGHLYIFDENLVDQHGFSSPTIFSQIEDEEKTFSISFLKLKTKATRNPLSRWSIGTGSLNEFSFSPDQCFLACVSQDGFLRIFHYEKMQLIAFMKSYFGGLLCLCWSPDGRYVATGGEDDFVTVFALENNDQSSRVVCRGVGHTSWISGIAFDPNVQNVFYRFASVGQDHRLCFWEIQDDILTNFSFETRRICQISGTSSFPLISTVQRATTSTKSRWNFARYTSKSSETPSTRSSVKKTRKLSLLHLNGPNSSSIAPATENEFSQRRNPNELTKTIFGTKLCPRFDAIPLIEPIVNEIIGFQRLNGLFFNENFLLTSSQDGLIGVWEKFPNKN